MEAEDEARVKRAEKKISKGAEAKVRAGWRSWQCAVCWGFYGCKKAVKGHISTR